jgi:hypothetical protein
MLFEKETVMKKLLLGLFWIFIISFVATMSWAALQPQYHLQTTGSYAQNATTIYCVAGQVTALPNPTATNIPMTWCFPGEMTPEIVNVTRKSNTYEYVVATRGYAGTTASATLTGAFIQTQDLFVKFKNWILSLFA